jgi:hypothetical protein
MNTRSLPAESWATLTAIVTALALVIKKLLSRYRAPKPEPLTRSEFHHELESTRNRIGGSFLGLSDKIDSVHSTLSAKVDTVKTDLAAMITDQGANFERRIDQLEINLARVDERTRL